MEAIHQVMLMAFEAAVRIWFQIVCRRARMVEGCSERLSFELAMALHYALPKFASPGGIC